MGSVPNQSQLIHNYTSSIPNSLSLIQVHWYIRHGERSPVSPRMTSVIPPTFNLCSISRQFNAALLTFANPSAAADTANTPSIVPDNNIPFTTRTRLAPPGITANDDTVSWQGASDIELRTTAMKATRLTELTKIATGHSNGTISPLDECYFGELTDLGRQSLLSFGSTLRSLYTSAILPTASTSSSSTISNPFANFLPPVLPGSNRSSGEKSIIEFRSTGMQRTMESLTQFIEGLYPREYRKSPSSTAIEESETRVEFAVRSWEDESLYPNSMCGKMKQLDRAGAAVAATKYNPELAELDSVLGKYVDGAPIRIDGHPRVSGILDTIKVCQAHGIPVPAEFNDPVVMEKLERAVVGEWFDIYQSSPLFTQLAMGRLLGDLKTKMTRKVTSERSTKKEDDEPLKLAVYSCHDTSLAGILNTLEVFDRRWPPFSSHISFELFSTSPASSPPSTLSKNTPARHYVRSTYNTNSLVIPHCKKEGNHFPGSEGVFCTFEAFSEAVAKVEMKDEDWRRICKDC